MLSIAGIGWGTHTVFEVRKTGQPISVRHSALSFGVTAKLHVIGTPTDWQ